MLKTGGKEFAGGSLAGSCQTQCSKTVSFSFYQEAENTDLKVVHIIKREDICLTFLQVNKYFIIFNTQKNGQNLNLFCTFSIVKNITQNAHRCFYSHLRLLLSQCCYLAPSKETCPPWGVILVKMPPKCPP